ncbi:hypothetical protein NEUTE1DRAFT_10111, partial [Neurospora tetrasperma FGSC 2508]
AEFFSRFNFRITYKKGPENIRPDTLSRKLKNKPRDKDNKRLLTKKKPLIDPEYFN